MKTHHQICFVELRRCFYLYYKVKFIFVYIKEFLIHKFMLKNLPVRVDVEAPRLFLSEVEMTWAELEDEDDDEDEDPERIVVDLVIFCFFPKL